jgi:hypothetical protein
MSGKGEEVKKERRQSVKRNKEDTNEIKRNRKYAFLFLYSRIE